MTVMPLRSFRLVCKPDQTELVEGLLRAEGYTFTPEPFFPLARRLLEEPRPLGASLASRFGYVYIQDRSSMLPPLVLSPDPGAAVLDMCASPGSKTGLLGQMVGKNGFVLGNEPSKARLNTLRHNMQALNLLCCGTCSHPGERLPFPEAGRLSPPPPDGDFPGWDFIQLDPPCSGWGTVDKHPQVTRLWHGDKIRSLIAMQRRLLKEAARLLNPGGRISYSTCTTNVEENEVQVRYARDALGLTPLPALALPGFAFADSMLPDVSGVLRVDTGRDGQGFFVALLEKNGSGSRKQEEGQPSAKADFGSPDSRAAGILVGASEQQADSERQPPAGLARGCFIRPWKKESRFVGERRRHGSGKRVGAAAGAEILPHAILEERGGEQGIDPNCLPKGRLAVYSGQIHFLPTASDMLPQGFPWKAFVLGKMGKGGEIRLHPGLHTLMPRAEAWAGRGGRILNLEDTAPLYDLCKGHSLPVTGGTEELCLYFRNLPLCRLSIKGKRAMLPALFYV